MPFVIFGPLTPLPPPRLFLVCLLFPVALLFYFIYLFKPDCFTLRVRGRVTKSSLITVFMDKFNALERIFCSLSVILFKLNNNDNYEDDNNKKKNGDDNNSNNS